MSKANFKSTIRVIKLGGSLLSNANTPERISRWLANQADPVQPAATDQSRNFWIVGGGELVDTVRDWDAKFSLDPKLAHWASVDLMDINSRLLAAWFPQWAATDRHETSQTHPKPTNVIALTGDWIRRCNIDLPESWQTTSDSIAAAFADYIKADELVLLKSCDPPAELSLKAMTESDVVDEQFVPQIRTFKRGINVRLVNLNDDRFAEASFKSDDC